MENHHYVCDISYIFFEEIFFFHIKAQNSGGELVNALQAQEQRRMMRHEEAVQGVFHIKAQNSGGGKDKKNNKWKNKKPAESSNKQQNDTFLPCPH